MDQKWLEEQKEEIGLALAKQGIRLVVPVEKQSRKRSSASAEDSTLASFIDHTLLKPTASQAQITQICQEALDYHFASVCVNPVHVPIAARILRDSDVRVCTVIGFPLGATSTLTKVLEARDAVAAGAEEIDMVLNIGSLLERDYARVYSDIKAVRDAVSGQVLKVILETGYLSKEQIVRGCILAKMAGADFVKTSTGFGPGGATVEDVSLMREVVGPDCGVKASGGIRDVASALAMIKAGANRLGASSGVAIIEGLRGEADY
ncbi:MAG TPA: deoxyribose-phosphate aldolase [Firmicutes bacterium]|jgi:deoxyribose-phosphate aldolase|nr:deoxyribose-phosphate aldolase [Bacillota bacterium]